MDSKPFILKKNVQLLSLGVLMIALPVGFTNCARTYDIAAVSSGGSQSEGMTPGAGAGAGGAGVGGAGTGEGLPDGAVGSGIRKMTKTFQATDVKSKVDILIVDDNSMSMQWIQSSMANRFDHFVSQIDGLDYQIGFITADVNGDSPLKDGRLIQLDQSSNYVISSSMTPAAINGFFKGTIQRTETGSEFEQPILATMRALERSMTVGAVNQPNRDFFRSGAALAVVAVTNSNEEMANYTDSSGNYHSITNYNAGLLKTRNTKDFVGYFNRYFPGKTLSWNSIIVKPGDLDCLKRTDFENESYGVNLATLSQKTNGVIGSVCESDYGAQLGQLGQRIQEVTTNFGLDCDPVDINADGKADVTITTNSGSSPATLHIEGRLLKSDSGRFSKGDYTVDYYCAAIVK